MIGSLLICSGTVTLEAYFPTQRFKLPWFGTRWGNSSVSRCECVVNVSESPIFKCLNHKTKMVEAAGIEPDPGQSTNRLMAHDFCRNTLIPCRFPPSIESPGVPSCPLESTPVVEIFWRRAYAWLTCVDMPGALVSLDQTVVLGTLCHASFNQGVPRWNGWVAVQDVWPETRQQRCWVHRKM